MTMGACPAPHRSWGELKHCLSWFQESSDQDRTHRSTPRRCCDSDPTVTTRGARYAPTGAVMDANSCATRCTDSGVGRSSRAHRSPRCRRATIGYKTANRLGDVVPRWSSHRRPNAQPRLGPNDWANRAPNQDQHGRLRIDWRSAVSGVNGTTSRLQLRPPQYLTHCLTHCLTYRPTTGQARSHGDSHDVSHDLRLTTYPLLCTAHRLKRRPCHRAVAYVRIDSSMCAAACTAMRCTQHPGGHVWCS
uniref:Uncharacterized protein n=1 Tax=Mycolicibacterium sp. CBMA 213 TaxID=1968788 RepID=A0A1S6GKK7_9MYCO|nr:hypothetical protein pCBMA213_2_00034 [Mycolicibacterium sp. CBMA 213]